jgi:hypothetical protein
MAAKNENIAFTKKEMALLKSFKTPFAIQNYVDSIPYSTDNIYRCPRTAMADRKAHCFDGAVLAAAALRVAGYPPLILEMIPNGRDDDHIIALFRENGHWGAVAKSNFVGLRFREPIYRTLRELVMSYFEGYYNVNGEKTLRGYTASLSLKMFDSLHWTTDDTTMDRIATKLEKLRRFQLITGKMANALNPVDRSSYSAGLLGANKKGLFQIS